MAKSPTGGMEIPANETAAFAQRERTPGGSDKGDEGAHTSDGIERLCEFETSVYFPTVLSCYLTASRPWSFF